MATKDCTFFVDIDGRQVEMDFDGFRAYLMQDGVMATLAPDLTAKRGKKAGFTVTAQKAEPTPARAEAPKARAEGTTKKTEAPAPTELEVSAENLRKLMPKLGKRRAEAIIAVMKAMGIPFDRLKLAKGKVEAKGTLQQADVKARDAEYMAAVKSGDTAKAQKMVEEAAKAAGYTTGPVEHGSGARFTQFKPEFQGTVTEAKSTSGAWFFTDGTRTAKGYAVYAAEEGPIKQLMRQAEAAERKGDWDTYERLIQQAEDAVYGEEGAAATAERRKNAVVYKGFLRGKFKTIDAQGETPATLSASEDFVEFDGSITAAIIAAKRQGFDGLIIQNLDDAPGVVEVANHFVVWDSSQFKSADPITYDDKGNVIPLSERFKPESPDIRYQEEASPLGSITFIDDLNALISVFEKANFSTVLHEAMHFYRRHMLNTENGFTAEEIKRFERWAGAKNGNWTVAAEEKAARAFEKYLRDGIAPIPELRDLFRKVARWMREVYATLTGSPVDIDIPADIRQVFDRIFTLEAERQRKAGGQAPPAAGTQSLQQADTKARDAEYMAAVKSGDTAKAQKMVDEAARATGYGSEKFYHGTVDIWTIANTADRAKTFDTPNAFGDNIGLFLSSRRNSAKHFAAGRYSPNQTQVTYDITYPDGGTIRNAADTRQEAEEFVNGRDGFVITESSKRTKASADEQLIYTFRHNIQNPKKYTSLRAFVDDVRVNGTSQASLIAEGYDGVSIKGGDLFARNEEWLVVFDPSQIKSADPITYDDKGNVIPLSQRFKPESPDIRYQREGEGVPQAETATAAYRRAMKERQRKPDTTVTKVRRGSKTLYQTEVTPKEGPVYTDNILEAMKKWSPKGTVEQLKAHLSKFKGAIAEANWIGLPVFLEGRDRVTRAEVEQFVKDNEISIQEVLLGEPGAPPELRARFGGFTLEPSGENYRELLLTIKPQSPRLIQTATGQRVYEPSTQRLSRTMNAVEAERELGRLLGVPTPTFVQPVHYPTPNIVVHVRFNERTMADGNKVLFLEEIQSDWAQAWRRDRTSRAATPFEDTPVWTALAFKRMLRWATDTGFDKIAWTTGRMQARRWRQTVTVTDTPRTDIESIEFTKVQYFSSTDPNAWDLTVRLLNGKEERYQAITTDTLKEEFGSVIANEIVRAARSIPGGMQPGQKRTISPPLGRPNAAAVRVLMLVREEEIGFWDSDDTWSIPVLVVTETGPDGRVTTLELDPSTTAVDYFGNTLLERILTQPAFDDYYEAVLEAREEGRPEPPAPEFVLSQEDLASIEATRETTRLASQIANAMMTYYDTIIPKEVKKLIKPFGGTVTTERLESGQTVHTVTVTDKMKAQARQGQVLFQREGEGVPKEQTATEAYRKYQQEQRQKNVQAAFARLRQQATTAKPEETKIKAKPEAAKVQAETATAAYRRAMKEQQQERAAKALQSLNQPPLGWRKPVTFAPAQPRPSLEITPMNRRAVIEAMEELRKFRRTLELRGVNITNASDVDLDRWEQLLNRIEQLGKVNPITPQMDAEYSKVVQELQARYKYATLKNLARQALEDDKFLVLHDKAATVAFGISRLVLGSTHAIADNRMVEKRLAAKVLGLDVRNAENLTVGELLAGILKDRSSTGVLAEHRKAMFEVIKKSFNTDEFVRKATTLSNWRKDFIDYAEWKHDRFTPERLQHLDRLVGYALKEVFKRSEMAATVKFTTGEPALVSVYRGGDLRGGEFQEQFLGSFTGAPSARMGYFFAGREETSTHYSKNVQRYVVAMYNPFVYDYKGNRYREESLGKVIMGAWMDGHDGVIAMNIYDPDPIDNVFVIPPGGENRIKTYGLAYDAKGKVIPLSERFNPTTKNVLYQGEDPLPNPEGTSTEAFRRKQAEQRQKNLIDAMNRLRQGQAQAPKGEPKAAQPKAATEPSQARQAQTTAPRAAKTAASTPRRGFGGKSLDDIFDALLKQAKAGQLGVSKEAPATPSELLEERIKRGLRDVLDAVYNKRVQPESAVDTARNAAANLLAAHQAGEQSAIDAATAEFRQVVSESRKAARGPQAPRPPRPKATVAERYAKMMGRINEKPKPAAKATPAELAEMTVRQLLRRMEKQLKVAKSQGIDVEQMEVNGTTVSRKEFFVNAADEYQDAYVKQDIPRQQAAYDRMRMAVDTIVTSLQKGKSRPNWHGIRSPLSYANVIGSYEGVMGQLGAEISELFKRTRTDINNKVMTFSEGMSFLQEQMNKVYKPLMKAQGYYGMPAIIDEHIKYLRFTAAFSARYTKIRKEQSIFKDPKAWYTTRRELSRELIDGQSAAFPMAAAMIKSVVYTAKLKYNLKSASTNYISLALSVGPYMRANELADIIYEAAKPSTWNRKVAGDRTLRDVAVGETGGRQAEGAPADEGLTHWWHRKDIFQLSSEHVRIAGYLVGERMAEREDQKLRAEGKAPLSDYVKARLIRDWIEKVEFDNSPWNIAPLFRGPVASVAFQFKPFLQKNVERFIADLQRDPEAFVLSDPRTPLGQITSKIPWKYRRVIGTIGQQVMWGGIGSLLTAVPYLKPLAGVFILAGLVNALKGMTDDDEFAEDLAVAIYYGAPAAIGTDLSSSVGFFEEPYGKTVHEQAVNFFLGPLASTALNVVQEDIKFLETAQKEPRLGGEEEKRKEMLRRGINIAKQVTPYVRMLESAVDLAQGEGSTMRLDKEEELTKWETAIRALGGAPLKQTMFFDEKEAYGWQKSLLGKPTGFERLKKKEGESDASYFRRKAKTDQWERTYLRRLEQNPRYRRLKPEEQEAVRENLWRNFAEESGKLRPDTSKFDASGLLERRAERVRSR